MHKPIYISICNQKGGVGKSSFTLLAACYMYHKGYNVAIVDCDYPQHTISNLRKWEVEQIQTNEFYNRQAEILYSTLSKPIFPVLSTSSDDALGLADRITSDSTVDLDVIFFDLPGTVNNAGVLHVLEKMDYYFTPVEASLPVLESSLNFVCGIEKLFQNKKDFNRVHIFWNKVDRREKNDLYSLYEEKVINPLHIPVLQTRIPLSSRFRKTLNGESRQFLISSIFPPTPTSVRDTNIDIEGFVSEIISIIKL